MATDSATVLCIIVVYLALACVWFCILIIGMPIPVCCSNPLIVPCATLRVKKKGLCYMSEGVSEGVGEGGRGEEAMNSNM